MTSELLSNIVTVLFCGAVVYLMLKYRKQQSMANDLPGIVTSIGVMGTFVGIFLGLLNFDPRNLEASVPALLEGLKTAFITSIFGMGAAFMLKIQSSLRGVVEGAAPQSAGATIDTLAGLLERAHKSSVESAKESEARLKSIETAIVGDGESTIHTQIIKMRTSIADKQEELIKEFKTFAVQMAENNSKAFIKALEEVIRDFNTKITEQFGDNFKQLNLAVGQLLEWQENYKLQIERMVAQLDQSAKAIDSVSVSVGAISAKSESLVAAAQSLESILRELNEVKKETERNLKGFSDAAREAKELLPQVEKFLKEASTDVSRHLVTMVDGSGKAIEAHNRAIADQRKQIDDMLTKSSNDVGKMWQALAEANRKVLDTHTGAMKERFDAFDDSMGKELKKALETLGGQLASLSNKFVQDYTPLTENLREVVRIAKDIKR